MHANRGNGRQPRKKMYYYERLGHCICAHRRENYIEMSAKNSPGVMWGNDEQENPEPEHRKGSNGVGVRDAERRTGEGQKDRKEREQHWEKT